jgi:Cof subfamily protein (haloacid dehalogenase superfamily)
LLPDGSVTARTVKAVRAAAAAGFRICFATGRSLTESRAVLHEVGVLTESVFVGGAMVVDTRSERTLHHTAMEAVLAGDVCRTFESMGHAALAMVDVCEQGVDYVITGSIATHPATQRWMARLKMTVRYVPSLASFPHENTLRVGICCSIGDSTKLMPVVREHYGHRTMLHNLLVPGMDCEVLEVFDPAVSKWSAVSYIAKMHGILPEQIIAIGDDLNDAPMLQHAGLGVAMGNAREGLKPFADRVIGNNIDDALAVFLDELVANKAEAAA